MKYLYLLVFFPFYSLAQNADWKELQDKINCAVKENKVLLITRNYTIDKPLIIENWRAGRSGFRIGRIVDEVGYIEPGVLILLQFDDLARMDRNLLRLSARMLDDGDPLAVDCLA